MSSSSQPAAATAQPTALDKSLLNVLESADSCCGGFCCSTDN